MAAVLWRLPAAALCSCRAALAGPSSSAGGLLNSRRLSTIPDPDVEELYSLTHATEPNFVHAVSITQLDQLCRSPSLQRLVNSATFLKSQLPARLQNHIYRLEALPKPEHTHLQQLLYSTISSKTHGLEVAKDWKLVPTDDMEGLRHFEAHLSTFKEHLEVEVARLTLNAQQLTESRGWWHAPHQVSWLNRMLDLNNWFLLSTRVMLAQHSAALAALESSSSSSSPSSAAAAAVSHYHEPGHASTNPALPYTPPHQQLASEDRPVSLIRRHTLLKPLLQNVVEDCRAFCVEKNSAAPDVELTGPDDLAATLVVPYVEFVLTEVLKNAMQAVISRYGAWEVDDAPPVLVEISELPGSSSSSSSSSGADAEGGQTASVGGSVVEIRVTDAGNGIPASHAGHMYDYFWSQSRPSNTLYGYSRNHGSQFQGIGVGVPMSRVYAAFMGGSIEWETDSWRRHTTVTFRLPKHGFTF